MCCNHLKLKPVFGHRNLVYPFRRKNPDRVILSLLQPSGGIRFLIAVIVILFKLYENQKLDIHGNRVVDPFNLV
jgi:hypothetical protein